MRTSTLIVVLSALAAGITSAHPIAGVNDGGDAYSGAASAARGGDIEMTEKKGMGNPNAGLFFDFKGGKQVHSGNGGLSKSGNAVGGDGGIMIKRQQDSVNVDLDYTNGLLGDVPLNLRRDIDNEKRLLDGGSEISRQGGAYNGQNNGNLLGGILGRDEHAQDKRFLDGGSEINRCAGNGMQNGMQKRILDGGSEITRCGNNGLGNILSRDTHEKRLLDGGSEISSTGNSGLLGGLLGRDVEEKRFVDGGSELSSSGNSGLLGGLLGRDVEEKRLLDFWSAPENQGQQPQQYAYAKRLLDFGKGRCGQRRPDNDGPEQPDNEIDNEMEKRLLDFAKGVQRRPDNDMDKRLLDFASAPGAAQEDSLLGLKRSVDKRLVGVGADLDDTVGELGLVKKNVVDGLLGLKGTSLGTGSGRTNLTSGNGGKSLTGNATGGRGGLGGGNGGDAYTGAASDASAGSIKLNRRQAESANEEEAAEAEELTPMDKGVGAAGAVAGTPFGKAAKLDKLAGAAGPAMPFFKQE